MALSISVGSGDLCWCAWPLWRPASPSLLFHVALARGCLRQRAPRATQGPSRGSSLTCCLRAVGNVWGPPSGPLPPSLPPLPYLGHLGVQQQQQHSSELRRSKQQQQQGLAKTPSKPLRLTSPLASPLLADHPCVSAPFSAHKAMRGAVCSAQSRPLHLMTALFLAIPSLSFLTLSLLLSTAVGLSQDHPCGSLSTWPPGGL